MLANQRASCKHQFETLSQQMSDTALGRIEEFFLYTTFLEASMIDKKGADKPISFESEFSILNSILSSIFFNVC